VQVRGPWPDHPDDPSGPSLPTRHPTLTSLDPSGAIQVDAEHPARNRKVGNLLRLTTSSWPRSSRTVSLAVAARLLPGSGIWNDAGLAEMIRQAGDQGCCGVEVRGFEPLASSVRASWG
jgi:hydroxypyruvate isomerase